jgi:glycerol-3-phosphate dehydrogenase (NAD(P)+)
MKIAVIGAGAWGTALAVVLGRKGTHDVRLWAFEPEVREAINQRHVNELFLAGLPVPETVRATGDYADALRDAELIVSVMPSNHCRRMFADLQKYLAPEMLIVSASKGIENQTLLRMTEVIDEVVHQARRFKPRLGALSGPSFAREVARGDPTAITIASADAQLASAAQNAFSDPAFRVYSHQDVVGAELGGALKNVIAIAAGICDGLGLGHNSIAGLVTRGLTEITRLVVACGGRRETMAGLAGLGDLVLTCTGGLSRNRTVGVELGRGRKLPEIIAGMHGMVAEGVLTTNAAVELARRKGVQMPLTEQMYLILREGKSPADAIRDLMARPTTMEFAGFS